MPAIPQLWLMLLRMKEFMIGFGDEHVRIVVLTRKSCMERIPCPPLSRAGAFLATFRVSVTHRCYAGDRGGPRASWYSSAAIMRAMWSMEQARRRAGLRFSR